MENNKKSSQMTVGELARLSLQNQDGVNKQVPQNGVTSDNYHNYTFNQMGSRGRGSERRKPQQK